MTQNKLKLIQETLLKEIEKNPDAKYFCPFCEANQIKGQNFEQHLKKVHQIDSLKTKTMNANSNFFKFTGRDTWFPLLFVLFITVFPFVSVFVLDIIFNVPKDIIEPMLITSVAASLPIIFGFLFLISREEDLYKGDKIPDPKKSKMKAFLFIQNNKITVQRWLKIKKTTINLNNIEYISYGKLKKSYSSSLTSSTAGNTGYAKNIGYYILLKTKNKKIIISTRDGNFFDRWQKTNIKTEKTRKNHYIEINKNDMKIFGLYLSKNGLLKLNN